MRECWSCLVYYGWQQRQLSINENVSIISKMKSLFFYHFSHFPMQTYTHTATPLLNASVGVSMAKEQLAFFFYSPAVALLHPYPVYPNRSACNMRIYTFYTFGWAIWFSWCFGAVNKAHSSHGDEVAIYVFQYATCNYTYVYIWGCALLAITFEFHCRSIYLKLMMCGYGCINLDPR